MLASKCVYETLNLFPVDRKNLVVVRLVRKPSDDSAGRFPVAHGSATHGGLLHAFCSVRYIYRVQDMSGIAMISRAWQWMLALALAVATVPLLSAGASAQPGDSTYRAPRTPDGNPDLNGIWQAIGSAHWDIEDHAARMGAAVELGAIGAIPAGLGVVEGGEIPYHPEALATRNDNRDNWLELDPAVKCYMPGIPRATYMPFPFQIVQTPSAIMFGYEYTSSTRAVRMDRPGTEADLASWMGYGLGRWEGETLVVDVTSQMPDTWFDSSGNFHSEELVVEERYTPIGPNALFYEATIEDPQVFTRPWKISMPLYRRLEEDARLLEFKCIPFAEEAMFGEWYRR